MYGLLLSLRVHVSVRLALCERTSIDVLSLPPLRGRTSKRLANIEIQSLGVVEKQIEVYGLVSLCEANQETLVVCPFVGSRWRCMALLLSLRVQISKRCFLLSVGEQLKIYSRYFLFKGAHRRTCSPSL